MHKQPKVFLERGDLVIECSDQCFVTLPINKPFSVNRKQFEHQPKDYARPERLELLHVRQSMFKRIRNWLKQMSAYE